MQGLPKNIPGPAIFNGQQLNTGEFAQSNYAVRQQQQLRKQQQFGSLRQAVPKQQQNQFPSPNTNSQKQQTEKLRQPQPQFQIRAGRIQVQNNGQFNPQFVPIQQFQQQQSFVPTTQTQQQSFAPQQPQQLPRNQYGPPLTQYGPPQPPQQYPSTENSTPNADEDIDSEPVADDNNDNDDDNEGPAISVSNAGANGQYYILTPDNTLQKVIYMTSQTEDDVLTNGFTAQLRYEPVEPIRDPVYGYDAEGHLVKIYNKK